MFSSNPFPQLTNPTIHVFPPSNSFLDQEKNNLYTNPFENNITNEQDLVKRVGMEQYDVYKNNNNSNLFWSEIKNKNTSNKDHHSKIHTAQGPRDRRVRLSIEVAKKFFYLQDLLGVDKASKTLDWLFEKSKIPIDDLIKTKKESSSSTNLTDQSEVVFLETGLDEQAKGRRKKYDEETRKKRIRKYKSGISVNKSRAEARARARERTKEKLNIKKLEYNESKSGIIHVDCCSSNSTLQSSFWNTNESQKDYIDKFGESVMEDKIPMLYSYQHNFAVLNDSSNMFTGLPKFTNVPEQPQAGEW